MNVGILGAGFMGGTHARAFAKLSDVKVRAVSSRTLANAEKLAAEVGAAPTDDPLAIIHDPNIDVISNTLPNHLHAKFTIAALKAGKPVLLEKPFGLTAIDCDAMMAAQKTSRKPLMVAHVLRFWPEYRALVEFVHSGALGKPLSAVASRLSVAPGAWFSDPRQSGGAVLDLMVHDLDALNWLFGKPKSVYARGQRSKTKAWDHMLVTLDYGKASGMIEASEMLPPGYPFSMTLKVLCQGGTVEFAFRAGGVSVEMGGGSSLTVYEAGNTYTLEAPGGDAYKAQVAYFVDCVRSKHAIKIGTPQQARAAVVLSNATRKSLETGSVVAL